MNKQEKPLGVRLIFVINSIPIIIAVVGCIMVIIKYSGYPGASAAGISRVVGSISATAFLPGFLIRSVLKRRYSSAMFWTVISLLMTCNYPLYLLVSLPTFIILFSNPGVQRYLNKEEKNKDEK